MKLPPAPCEDVKRIELSRVPTARAQEICVSPGLMTGFLFDTPVIVEMQDEVRFVEVIRGRNSISFVPPRDMVPGERLRLTAHFEGGASHESFTFALMAHSGRATRQVEVYRDQRTRESYQQELAQERAKSQQLQEQSQWLTQELERMQKRSNQPVGLRDVIVSGSLGPSGVQALELANALGYSENGLMLTRGTSYRSNTSVAVEAWLKNSGTEPWTLVGASLITNGEPVIGMVWQAETILPDQVQRVLVEVSAIRRDLRGETTLSLWDAGPRVITISELRFP